MSWLGCGEDKHCQWYLMAIDKQADRKVGRQRKPHSVIGFGGVREGSIQRAEHGEINVVINVYTHTSK